MYCTEVDVCHLTTKVINSHVPAWPVPNVGKSVGDEPGLGADVTFVVELVEDEAHGFGSGSRFSWPCDCELLVPVVDPNASKLATQIKRLGNFTKKRKEKSIIYEMWQWPTDKSTQSLWKKVDERSSSGSILRKNLCMMGVTPKAVVERYHLQHVGQD